MILLTLASLGQAAQPGLEMVLIPLDYGDFIPGAFGSVWEPDLWVSVDGEREIIPSICFASVCGPVAGSLKPSQPWLNPFRGSDSSIPGVVWFLHEEDARFVHFDLRLRETSQGTVRQGIHIPIVREAELYTRPLELLNVPVDTGKRTSLRIYNPDAAGDDAHRDRTPALIRLEILTNVHQVDSVTLVDQTLELPVPDVDPRREPGVVQFLSLREHFPALIGSESVRIRISPLEEGLRIWAMASVTDNETQYVSLITPE